MISIMTIPTPADSESSDPEPPSSGQPRGLAAFLRKFGFGVIITSLLTLFTIVVLWPRMVIAVHAGEVGVMWYRFTGTDLETSYFEGTHLILPWDLMTVYDTRVSTVDYDVPVLSTDGLEISVSVTVRYHPVYKTAPQLHQGVGPDYVSRIVIPEVVTAVREVMGLYRPEQLYTLRTVEMQRQIVARAKAQALERYIVVDDVLIRRIQLPETVQEAIQSKLKQEQEALEYEYRIDRERLEAERKEIEAEGIQRYRDLVAQGLPDGEYERFLRLKGIEATLEIATSENSKVVVVGPGDEGLPVILNPGD